MDSTAARCRKFKWRLRRIAEVNLCGKARAWVTIAILAFPTSRAQELAPPRAAVSNVTAEDLLARPIGANWTSYNGDYTGRRYGSLKEINSQNVARLRAAWVFHPGNAERLEVTPVVVNGVMYVTSANDAFALDARTGRVLWHHARSLGTGSVSYTHLT